MTSPLTGGIHDPLAFRAVALDWGGVCERATGVDPFASRFVVTARARGLVVVVLSNELDPARIPDEPALAEADHVLSLASSAIAKPDRRAFLRAARLADIDPTLWLAIDDHQQNLAGAEAAGMRALPFDGADPATSWAACFEAIGAPAPR
jgi:FMN phosphatase YigB (HAD superfamily)